MYLLTILLKKRRGQLMLCGMRVLSIVKPLKHGVKNTCVLHTSMRRIVLDTNCLLQSPH